MGRVAQMLSSHDEESDGRRPRSLGRSVPRHLLAALALGACALLFLPQCDVTGLRSAVEKRVMPPAGSPALSVLLNQVEIFPGDTALDFGSYVVNDETSTAATFVIENNGNGPLVLSDAATKVQLGGVDAAHFVLSTQATETTIQAGKSTHFSVAFKPTTLGKKSATVTVAYNGAGTPFQFTLIGTGTATPVPQINVKYLSATILPGGSYNIGAWPNGVVKQLYFTIENLGGEDLYLNGTPTVALSGPPSFTWGSTPPSSPVASRGSVAFIINFTPPPDSTPQTATLTIPSDDPDSTRATYVVNVTGTGIAPDIALYQSATFVGAGTTLDLGDAELNYGKSYSFSIKNTGTGTLSLTGSPLVAISGLNASDFTVTAPSANSLAPNAAATFTLSFKPTGTAANAGPRSATLSIANNVSAKNPYAVALRGNAIAAPKISVTPSGKVEFGKFFDKLIETMPYDKQFTITNVGSANLVLSGSEPVTLATKYPGSFAIEAQPASSTIIPNGSTTFTVRFTPQYLDYQDAEISIASNDSDATLYSLLVMHEGKVIAAPDIDLAVNKQTVSSGSTINMTLPAGQKYSIPILINNLGHAVLLLNASSGTPTIIVTGDSGDFGIKCPDAPYEIKPNTPIECVATFLGAKSGTVTNATFVIPNNDPGGDESPYVVSVSITSK